MKAINKVILLITKYNLYYLARPQVRELLISENCPPEDLDSSVEKVFSYFQGNKKNQEAA